MKHWRQPTRDSHPRRLRVSDIEEGDAEDGNRRRAEEEGEEEEEKMEVEVRVCARR